MGNEDMTPLEFLTFLRANYPALMSPAQIGDMLNLLAWEFRGEGMALLGKKGGNNVPTPAGDLISSDYIVHVPTLTGHDVLTDNGTATELPTRNGIIVGFTWGPGPEPLEDAIASGARSIVLATDPGVAEIPVPVEPPVVVDPPKPDRLTLQAAVDLINAHTDERIESVKQQIDQVVKNAEKSAAAALGEGGAIHGLLGLFGKK